MTFSLLLRIYSCRTFSFMCPKTRP